MVFPYKHVTPLTLKTVLDHTLGGTQISRDVRKKLHYDASRQSYDSKYTKPSVAITSLSQQACISCAVLCNARYSNAAVHGRRGLGPVIITSDTSRRWPCLAPFNHQCAPQTTETIATHSFHCLTALLLAHTLMNETFWLQVFILRSCVRIRLYYVFLCFSCFTDCYLCL